jgi:nucleoside-diphosphate-sugar epimerase
MRIVVTGASGNVGTAVVRTLVAHDMVDAVVGICRRPHDWRPAKTTWVNLDVSTDDLGPALTGADVVVHLAWLFQPTHDPNVTWQNNVVGTQRVLAAVAAAEVPAVVVASSVGAYSPRSSLDPVDESWPTMGYAGAAYSREKSYVERMLDHHEALHPDRRVVRMRPAFIFQRSAALEQRRLFVGPLVPHGLLVHGRLPVVPLPRSLHLQALQADDVAAAYAEAALRPVHGAFNLGTDVLDPRGIASALGSRWVPLPAGVLNGAVTVGFHLYAVPASPGLLGWRCASRCSPPTGPGPSSAGRRPSTPAGRSASSCRASGSARTAPLHRWPPRPAARAGRSRSRPASASAPRSSRG